MRAPVSVCIIARDEPLLEGCLKSIRDYVDEIVVIDTGSKDNTPDIARKYADVVEVFTDCNNPETGLIEDFAMARSYSFSLAKNKWVMWCDADDIITGMDRLPKLLDDAEKDSNISCYLFPYEYAYNDKGECVLVHYRERLLRDTSIFKWVNPVHEVLIPVEGARVTYVRTEALIYKHQRQHGTKMAEPGRNLRILRKYVEKHGTSDARQLYYLGLELTNSNLLDEAIPVLTQYIEASGWDDEKCLACLKLVQIYQSRSDYANGVKWALKAIEVRETWGECYFAVGKMHYFMAQAGGPNTQRNWERCIFFLNLGLTMPPTQTMLFVNPLERELEVYEYLNMAYNVTGRVKEAFEAAQKGLAKHPDAQNLAHNKIIYENHLTVESITAGVDVLQRNGFLDSTNGELVKQIVHKKANAVTKDQTPSTVESKPATTFKTPVKFTTPATDKLDIVIWTGPAVEWWNPNSINTTGIGGSETACIQMAKNFAGMGHTVRVYSDCPHMEGTFDGVQYIHFGAFKDIECDIFISSRQHGAVEHNIKARAKFLWVHDVTVGQASANLHENLIRYDRILCLSEWHKNFFLDAYKAMPISSDSVIVTRNGIDTSRFTKIVPKKNKLIFPSSANRGLESLLDYWPAIREQVPDAELHVYYGFETWERMARMYNSQGELAQINNFRTRLAATPGVTWHGRVNQQTLADAFLESKVWAYPTLFTETSCITAMEAQAAGCVPVTTRLAALGETVKHGVLLDLMPTTPEYKTQFVSKVVSLLKDDEVREQLAKAGRTYAMANCDWSLVAKAWDEMFRAVAAEVASNIVPSFRG